MRKLVLAALLILMPLFLAACQGFLEDYSYAPLGTTSSTAY